VDTIHYSSIAYPLHSQRCGVASLFLSGSIFSVLDEFAWTVDVGPLSQREQTWARSWCLKKWGGALKQLGPASGEHKYSMA
jgi:hypothetical protein